MRDKYVSPFTDFGFKRLFGTEVNKDLLQDFLNELLKGEEEPIRELTFLKNEQLGRSEFDRNAVYDIYCENEKGEKFIVEIQKAKQKFFKDRSIFYSTFPIQDQAIKGANWNFELKAVYTVGILDFVFDEDEGPEADPKQYMYKARLVDEYSGKVFFDKLKYIYLALPKFRKTEEELETRFDKWLYILKNLPNFESLPPKLEERIFERFFRQAEIAQFTPEEHASYQDSLKVARDLNNVVETALEEAREEARKQGRDEGLEEGRQQGRQQGLKKGLEQGIEQGTKRATLLIAKEMKKKGIADKTIAELTGLSLEEIGRLEE